MQCGICGVEPIEEEEREEEEGRGPGVLRQLRLISKEEMRKHERTHLPYRPWCKIGVAARGKEDAHYRQDPAGHKEDEGGFPKVSSDYQEMNEAFMLRLMMGKDELTKSVPPSWRPGIATYPLRAYLQTSSCGIDRLTARRPRSG